MAIEDIPEEEDIHHEADYLMAKIEDEKRNTAQTLMQIINSKDHNNIIGYFGDFPSLLQYAGHESLNNLSKSRKRLRIKVKEEFEALVGKENDKKLEELQKKYNIEKNPEAYIQIIKFALPVYVEMLAIGTSYYMLTGNKKPVKLKNQ